MAWAGSGETLRGFELGPRVIPAAAGAAAAWLVVAALASPSSWGSCAFTGGACSAVLLAATSEWVVPTLLFFSCALLALAAASTLGRSRPLFWIVGFASVLALGGALADQVLGDGGWRIPESMEGWARYLVIGAGVVLAGAIPLSGHWTIARDRAVAAGPLLTGGGFVYLHLVLGEPDRWAALALLFVGLLFGLGAHAGTRFVPSLAGASVVSVMAAAACAGPQALNAAAVAAVIGTAALALGTQSHQGASSRTLLVGVFAPFVSIVAMGYLAAGSLSGSVTSTRAVERVPWTLLIVLMPLALAALLAAALRTTRSSVGSSLSVTPEEEPDRARRRFFRMPSLSPSTFAGWTLVAVSVAAALLPVHVLEIGPSFIAAAPRQLLLFGSAGLLALGGGWWHHRQRTKGEVAAPAIAEVPYVYEPGPRLGRVLSWISVLLAVAMAGLVGWITVEGLLVGFL
jgi:hypothetical protein